MFPLGLPPLYPPPPAPPPPPPKFTAQQPPGGRALAPSPAQSLTSLTLASQGMATAHTLVALAGSGDAGAQNAVANTIGAARGGDPSAIAAANAMTLAQKLQVQASYVQKWVSPEAAVAILRGAHMGLAQLTRSTPVLASRPMTSIMIRR